ncbi:hypothetical protein SK128_009177 [Halocaridina rubra]|uniref:Metalloendopeptidase n=1 Tax=Halocaridina rubra TaxID=373956 RepID=A0AAN8XVI5_HALRR
MLGEENLWPGGIVPYHLGPSITSGQQQVILDAMADYHSRTCIQFVERTWEDDYIEIVSDVPGCWSYFGRIGGMQRLTLDANGCIYVGTAIHELMHALGFYHEHTRDDRDNYVTIHYENILPGEEYNFDKDTYWQYVGENYNYASIMHYGTYTFSSDWGNLPTIVPHDPDVILVDAYEKLRMEDSDANQINNLYVNQCALRKT